MVACFYGRRKYIYSRVVEYPYVVHAGMLHVPTSDDYYTGRVTGASSGGPAVVALT
jgi:hypothetical protein